MKEQKVRGSTTTDKKEVYLMKNMIIERVDVWAAPIKDEPGGLATILSSLRDAGADLDFVISRRAPDQPGKGVVFVTPLRGDREVRAAAILGFDVTRCLHELRVEGDNEPGVAANLTEKLAAAGINLRGFSAAVIGTKFIMYIGFDTAEDAEKADTILKHYVEVLSPASFRT
jgi:hypothetical protein